MVTSFDCALYYYFSKETSFNHGSSTEILTPESSSSALSADLELPTLERTDSIFVSLYTESFVSIINCYSDSNAYH